MPLLMMSLSGCSNNKIVTKEEVPILPPDSLLVSPCKGVNLFSTPRELGENHIENLSCIKQFETNLQSIRDWKVEKQELYTPKVK